MPRAALPVGFNCVRMRNSVTSNVLIPVAILESTLVHTASTMKRMSGVMLELIERVPKDSDIGSGS